MEEVTPVTRREEWEVVGRVDVEAQETIGKEKV